MTESTPTARTGSLPEAGRRSLWRNPVILATAVAVVVVAAFAVLSIPGLLTAEPKQATDYGALESTPAARYESETRSIIARFNSAIDTYLELTVFSESGLAPDIVEVSAAATDLEQSYDDFRDLAPTDKFADFHLVMEDALATIVTATDYYNDYLMTGNMSSQASALELLASGWDDAIMAIDAFDAIAGY